MTSPIFQNLVSAYVKHKSSLECGSLPSLMSPFRSRRPAAGCRSVRTTVPSTMVWSYTSILWGWARHSNINGKSTADSRASDWRSFGVDWSLLLSFLLLCSTGGPCVVSDSEPEENSNRPSPFEIWRLLFPLEKSRASFAVSSLGASR